MGLDIKDAEISIKSDGIMIDSDELIGILQHIHNNFDCHAMSDYALYLEGRKSMLGDVIDYLERAK